MGKTIRCGVLIAGPDAPPLRNATIYVDEAGTIERVESEGGERPADVDWSAYTVLPGLIDAHDHPDIDLGDEVAQAAQPLCRATLVSVRNLRRILATGITTLRWVGAREGIDLVLREAVAEGLVEGPRLIVSGKIITRTGGHAWFWGHEADGADAIRRAVRAEVKAGVDWIKLMVTGGVGTPNSTPDAPGYTREEIYTAVAEAHLHGKRVACHGYGGDAVRWAVEAGMDTVEHGSLASPELLELMAAKGTTLVATMGIMEAGAADPGVPDYARAKFIAVRDRYLETLRLARERGVRVIVGTDINHGQLVREIEVLVEAGYSPLEALGAATWESARALGIDGETGSVATGKSADLIAVAGDPLASIGALRQVSGVCLRGRILA